MFRKADCHAQLRGRQCVRAPLARERWPRVRSQLEQEGGHSDMFIAWEWNTCLHPMSNYCDDHYRELAAEPLGNYAACIGRT